MKVESCRDLLGEYILSNLYEAAHSCLSSFLLLFYWLKVMKCDEFKIKIFMHFSMFLIDLIIQEN